MYKLSVNLNDETYRKLRWLIDEYNRDCSFKSTITMAIHTAINNEFSSVNLQLVEQEEEMFCDEKWLRNWKFHQAIEDLEGVH